MTIFAVRQQIILTLAAHSIEHTRPPPLSFYFLWTAEEEVIK